MERKFNGYEYYASSCLTYTSMIATSAISMTIAPPGVLFPAMGLRDKTYANKEDAKCEVMQQ